MDHNSPNISQISFLNSSKVVNHFSNFQYLLFKKKLHKENKWKQIFLSMLKMAKLCITSRELDLLNILKAIYNLAIDRECKAKLLCTMNQFFFLNRWTKFLRQSAAYITLSAITTLSGISNLVPGFAVIVTFPLKQGEKKKKRRN